MTKIIIENRINEVTEILDELEIDPTQFNRADRGDIAIWLRNLASDITAFLDSDILQRR